MDGLSGDQRFFAGWTQAWRAKDREESVRQRLLADPHAPDLVRATAPLRHKESTRLSASSPATGCSWHPSSV
ncbi:MAG: M13-type metalloendopeptidase [Candidatus Binatia bacterium]